MTNVLSDGLGLVQTAGRKARDGIGAVASGARDEVGTVVNGVQGGIDGIRQHGKHHAGHERKQSGWSERMVELAASAVGAVAAWFVSRAVRSALGRHGK